MNKWRFVKDDSDGCDIYQCLRCKNTFSSRTGCEREGYEGYKFCPMCGTKWEGEQKWQQDNYPDVPFVHHIFWAIESRWKTLRQDQNGWTEWTLELGLYDASAVAVKEELNTQKAFNGMLDRPQWYQVEYRVRAFQPDDSRIVTLNKTNSSYISYRTSNLNPVR